MITFRVRVQTRSRSFLPQNILLALCILSRGSTLEIVPFSGNTSSTHSHISTFTFSTMAPATPSTDDSHQQLLDQLDLTLKSRIFRNPRWKPSQRRNKNIKQIVAEAARREASAMATHNNSGTSTPLPRSPAVTTEAATPVPTNGASTQTNIVQAAQSLSTMVLERNLQASTSSGPAATYTNIESAPSLNPARQKRYCDITGLPASYTDPKTRLRYHNREIFEIVRGLNQGAAERYLEARGAHVVLK